MCVRVCVYFCHKHCTNMMYYAKGCENRVTFVCAGNYVLSFVRQTPVHADPELTMVANENSIKKKSY